MQEVYFVESVAFLELDYEVHDPPLDCEPEIYNNHKEIPKCLRQPVTVKEKVVVVYMVRELVPAHENGQTKLD